MGDMAWEAQGSSLAERAILATPPPPTHTHSGLTGGLLKEMVPEQELVRQAEGGGAFITVAGVKAPGGLSLEATQDSCWK